jgi:ribosomal protein S15
LNANDTAVCLRPALRPPTQTFVPVVQKANLSQKEKKQLQKQDPYRWAQMQQRKNANLKRRAELQKIRAEGWGDPVYGIPTPFVESFDSAGQAPKTADTRDIYGNVIREGRELPTAPHLLNHLLTREEVDEAIQHSYNLTMPLKSEIRDLVDPIDDQKEAEDHEERHKHAVEVINRIVSMDHANDNIRRHVNIRRCIDTFGRHNTDKFLKPKPPSIHQNPIPMPGRSGPDTGSSEVQIAILTVKIRKLAIELSRNKGFSKDKVNKRNLRLLVHRRQKLLKYMERKERGSERWTNMLEKLGLTPATWKEQITL